MASAHEKKPPQAAMTTEAAAVVDRLYRHHAGWLGKVLASRLRSTPAEVDDLVQETYVRVARYAGAEATRQPRALLMRIAVNLARDGMRRAAVRSGLAAEPGRAANLDNVVAIEADQHHLLELKSIILKLPPLYRDVFVLSRFTGLTYDEIASHVGVSVKTVEWRMGKALALCAAWMRD